MELSSSTPRSLDLYGCTLERHSLPRLRRRGPGAGARSYRSESRGSESSGSAAEWGEARRAELSADRAAIDAAWGQHEAENDIGALRWKAVRLVVLCCK